MIFNGRVELCIFMEDSEVQNPRSGMCVEGSQGWRGQGHTHTQMLQPGFPHICSPAVGPQLSIAQLFQLENVNSRERDTSVRGKAQLSSRIPALGEASHGTGGIWRKDPTLSRPDHRDVLSHAKHVVPSEGHSAGSQILL